MPSLYEVVTKLLPGWSKLCHFWINFVSTLIQCCLQIDTKLIQFVSTLNPLNQLWVNVDTKLYKKLIQTVSTLYATFYQCWYKVDADRNTDNETDTHMDTDTDTDANMIMDTDTITESDT